MKFGVSRLRMEADLFSRPLIIALLLAVVTFFVYWPAKQFEFCVMMIR